VSGYWAAFATVLSGHEPSTGVDAKGLIDVVARPMQRAWVVNTTRALAVVGPAS
jgi:hypothetical protein